MFVVLAIRKQEKNVLIWVVFFGESEYIYPSKIFNVVVHLEQLDVAIRLN